MKRTSGVTLMELLITIFILSVGTLAAIGSFKYITTSLQFSKARTLGSNLAQEQLEKLKNLSYYTLLVTTSTYSDSRFSPPLLYDTGNYPAQTIVEGGISFIRATRVDFAYQNGTDISTTSWTSDDTALKQLTVYVMWEEGDRWKSLGVQNLLANPAAVPLSASAVGTVKTPSNVGITGALVQAIDNTNWYGYADNSGSGNYRFSVSPGSYTIQASSSGYYTSTTSGYKSFTSGNSTTIPFVLNQISSVTVTGNLYKNDHLVISEVVASTGPTNNIEYINLYNPTTAPIDIGTNGGINSPVIAPITWDSSGNPSPHRLIYISTYVPVHGHYLITNTYPGSGLSCDLITIGGISVSPDACWRYYSYLSPSPNDHAIQQNDAGGISLGDSNSYISGWSGFNWSSWPPSGNSRIDSVAWNKSSSGTPAPANAQEGTALTPAGANGIITGEIIGRMTDPGNVTSGYGMGYDSDDNRSNFLDLLAIPGPPQNSSGIKPPNAGVPATGATVSANDYLANTASCTDTTVNTGNCAAVGGCRVCQFMLVVATGTWTLNIASGTLFSQIQNVALQANISTSVPNGSTTPSWTSMGNQPTTLLSNTTTFAFVTGHIYKSGGGVLSGIKVSDNSGHSATSTSAGLYTLLSSTGSIQLTANPFDSTMNHAYVSQTRSVESFDSGTAYSNRDFTLELGGIIRGYFMTSSNTPLPGRVATAQKVDGTDSAQGASDSTGYFYLQNLSTGTYLVTPNLDSMESASPTSKTILMSSTGTTTSVSTFTIVSGIAEITGQILTSVSTTTITTGALVIASTVPISSSLPPTLDGSSGITCSPCYYSASSDATGSYTLQVRNSTSPYYVYGWRATVDGTSASVTKSSAYNVTVSSPGQIGTQNLSW